LSGHTGPATGHAHAAPILHVDTRHDRLVETVLGRVVRAFAFRDVVSYAGDSDDEEEDEEDDEDEDAEAGVSSAAPRTLIITVRAAALHAAPNASNDGSGGGSGDGGGGGGGGGRVVGSYVVSTPARSAQRKHPQNQMSKTVEVRYRMQTRADLRALRHVLAQLAAGPVRWAQTHVRGEGGQEVGPDRYCAPRHPPHLEPSFVSSLNRHP